MNFISMIAPVGAAVLNEHFSFNFATIQLFGCTPFQVQGGQSVLQPIRLTLFSLLSLPPSFTHRHSHKYS